MNTAEQTKRAERARALRAKAAATTFEAERDTYNTKAAELEKRNADEGYIAAADPKPSSGNIYEDMFGKSYMDSMRAEKLRVYKEHIAAQQAGTLHNPNCMCDQCLDLDPMKIFKMYDNLRPTGPPPTEHKRTSHRECYENGWHDNTKAGRAACRRGRS